MIIFIKKYCMTQGQALNNFIRELFIGMKVSEDIFGRPLILVPLNISCWWYVSKLGENKYSISDWIIELIQNYFPLDKEYIKGIMLIILPDYL